MSTARSRSRSASVDQRLTTISTVPAPAGPGLPMLTAIAVKRSGAPLVCPNTDEAARRSATGRADIRVIRVLSVGLSRPFAASSSCLAQGLCREMEGTAMRQSASFTYAARLLSRTITNLRDFARSRPSVSIVVVLRLGLPGAMKRVGPPAPSLVDARKRPAIAEAATLGREFQQRPAGRHQKFFHVRLKPHQRYEVGERISPRWIIIRCDDERQIVVFFADALDLDFLIVPAEQPMWGLYLDLHTRGYRIHRYRAVSVSAAAVAQTRAIVRSRRTESVRTTRGWAHDAALRWRYPDLVRASAASARLPGRRRPCRRITSARRTSKRTAPGSAGLHRNRSAPACGAA